jgi:hypothetical protein
MESTPRTDDPWRRSQLFTVRVWCEQAEHDVQAVRIQVRHVLTGETRYFSAWPPLIDYVQAKLDHPSDPAYSA